MKKLISIVSCMFLALACVILVGCGKSNDKTTDLSNSPYVGTWKITEMTFIDETASADEYFEDDAILVLNADGTGTFSSGNEVSEGVWSETSKGIKVKGDDINLELEDKDGKLEASVIGVHLIFEKQ